MIGEVKQRPWSAAALADELVRLKIVESISISTVRRALADVK